MQHQPAQLAVQVGRGVNLSRARNFSVEQFWVRHAKTVVSKCAQAHRAKVGIPDCDGLRRAPSLIDLLARAEEVNIAFERRLEQLVPIVQIRQNRQRLRCQLVHAGAEDVGDFAFIDKHSHLGLPHCQRATVLNFHASHRIAPGQRAVAVLGPLNYVDELFLDKVH